MATLLNNHFASVFTVKNTDELPHLETVDHAGTTLDTVQFTPAIIEDKLDELERHKSGNPDNMHPRVLKELKGCLSQPCWHLHQVNGNCGGSRWVEDCQHDRDLQERWSWDRWHLWTDKFDIGCIQNDGKDNPQHARRFTWSITNSSFLRNMVSVNIESVWPTSWSLLASSTKNTMGAKPWIWYSYHDFQKAFDKVSYERLLLKVESLRIRGNLQHWICSSSVVFLCMDTLSCIHGVGLWHW